MEDEKKEEGKVCSQCKEFKPFVKFNKKHQYASGYQSWCKVCMAKTDMAKRDKIINKILARNLTVLKKEFLSA